MDMETPVLEARLKDLIDAELVSWKSVSKRLNYLNQLKIKLTSLDEQADFKEFGKMIKALNHPIRIQILLAIDKGVTCACELEYLTELAQATISHHLSLLEDANLIARIKEGKRNFFSIKNQQLLDSLITF
ncbi:hypothetical protein CEE45_16105 [Candidatus Heimdallarchaeota archaeon B3_Heim]|nr:MAG: hypothetical protein CEE45_16105 [Candidatus Heimdallarchaeota archaeon B3_Heim]